MAYTGQTIENPVSGERITFLQTARDTGGEKLEIELELSPDGHVPGAHVHPEQEERFHVLEGTMKFRMGMRKIVAGPGDTVVVPAGRVHKFSNGGDGVARARVEVVPALDMEQLFETTDRARARGQHDEQGDAQAAPPRAVHAPLRARGPRPVPARVDGALADGPAGVDRGPPRPRRALHAGPRRRLSGATPGGPSAGRPADACRLTCVT